LEASATAERLTPSRKRTRFASLRAACGAMASDGGGSTPSAAPVAAQEAAALSARPASRLPIQRSLQRRVSPLPSCRPLSEALKKTACVQIKHLCVCDPGRSSIGRAAAAARYPGVPQTASLSQPSGSAEPRWRGSWLSYHTFACYEERAERRVAPLAWGRDVQGRVQGRPAARQRALRMALRQ